MLNKKVYIVSICLKRWGNKSGERGAQNLHEFHFRGFYHGKRVNKLFVKGGDFEPCEEYILQAKITSYKEGALHCKCLKSKPIFNH